MNTDRYSVVRAYLRAGKSIEETSRTTGYSVEVVRIIKERGGRGYGKAGD